jgi:hypothetical protein
MLLLHEAPDAAGVVVLAVDDAAVPGQVAAGGVRSTARAAAARLPSRATSTKNCISDVGSLFTLSQFRIHFK